MNDQAVERDVSPFDSGFLCVRVGVDIPEPSPTVVVQDTGIGRKIVVIGDEFYVDLLINSFETSHFLLNKSVVSTDVTYSK